MLPDYSSLRTPFLRSMNLTAQGIQKHSFGITTDSRITEENSYGKNEKEALDYATNLERKLDIVLKHSTTTAENSPNVI